MMDPILAGVLAAFIATIIFMNFPPKGGNGAPVCGY